MKKGDTPKKKTGKKNDSKRGENEKKLRSGGANDDFPQSPQTEPPRRERNLRH